MMTIALTRREKTRLMKFLVCAWIISGIFGCTLRPAVQSGQSVSPDVQRKANETPIPLETTKENGGKRCEARYYFGERGSDPDEGYTPYCYKLQSKLIKGAGDGNLSDIREALRFGANPNLPVDDSFPPLQTAAASGRTEAERLLINNGARVNQISDFENTPLNAAAAGGYADVVKVLLESGADACYRSASGTAADIARSRGHKEAAELLKSADTHCK